MTQRPYCAICDQDQTQVPSMILARWHDQDMCTDCLENRPGKEEAEAEARGEMLPMTQEAYREGAGACCPFCRSEQVHYDSPVICEGIMTQPCLCNECEQGWMDHYRLAGYVRDDGGNGEDYDAFLRTAITEETETGDETVLVPTAQVAPGGEPTGHYALRGSTTIHLDGHEEEVEEVMDPQGYTIAYIHDPHTVDLFCAFMNKAHGLATD